MNLDCFFINEGLPLMMLLPTNIAGLTKIMTIATSKYIMVYKFACVCKLHSFTQKGVRNNSLVCLQGCVTREWWLKKKSMQIMKIDYCNFGLSMNAWTDHEIDSWNGKMTIMSWKHHGVCITIIKVKIHTNTNKEKFWMLREHRGVRQVIAAWAYWC